MLSQDEMTCRTPAGPAAPVRLLPSGDPYWLLQGSDRALLVPNRDHQRKLWTPRVWPGALLINGEVVGTWRRSNALMTVQPWRSLTAVEQAAVEAEGQSLPLPGIAGQIAIRWDN